MKCAPVLDDLPFLPDAPPLTPLSPEQLRFLRLHAHTLVMKWQRVLGGGTLRAYCEAGRSAAISEGALQDLVAMGLMERGYGDLVKVTAAGREVANGQ